MRRIKLLIVSSAVCGLTWSTSDVSAEDVYRAVDAAGRVTYSSSARTRDARPAQLPPIQRENFDSRLRSVQQATPVSCEQHGGVHCGAGPDADGSVLCHDGFSNAEALFRTQCLEAKLRTIAFSVVGRDGVPVAIKGGHNGSARWKNPQEFVLSLRNVSDVEAHGLKVRFAAPGQGYQLAAGPEKIEPYGLADYSLSLTAFPRAVELRSLDKTRYRISCENCDGAARNAE